MGHDHGQQRHGGVEERGGAIDDGAHRSIDRADHVRTGDQRSQPVREMNDRRRGNAREEVLRSAREPDDLVREHRTADENVIVLDDQPIQRDRHILLEAPSGDCRDLARRYRPQVGERCRIVPAMVEDARAAAAAVDDRSANQPTERRVVHWRVRTERDEIVECRHARAQLALEYLEHQWHRHRPGPIRNQGDDAPAIERQGGEAVADNARHGRRLEKAFGDPLSDHAHWQCRRSSTTSRSATKCWSPRRPDTRARWPRAWRRRGSECDAGTSRPCRVRASGPVLPRRS